MRIPSGVILQVMFRGLRSIYIMMTANASTTTIRNEILPVTIETTASKSAMPPGTKNLSAPPEVFWYSGVLHVYGTEVSLAVAGGLDASGALALGGISFLLTISRVGSFFGFRLSAFGDGRATGV